MVGRVGATNPPMYVPVLGCVDAFEKQLDRLVADNEAVLSVAVWINLRRFIWVAFFLRLPKIKEISDSAVLRDLIYRIDQRFYIFNGGEIGDMIICWNNEKALGFLIDLILYGFW